MLAGAQREHHLTDKGKADMQRVGVGRGMNRDGANTHLAAGAMDAEGDFAPVGDEDLLEHRLIR